MTTVDGKARLAETAKPLLNKIPAGVYRELLTGSLADAVGLTPAKIEKMLGEVPGSVTQRVRGGTSTLLARRNKAMVGQPSIVRRAIALLLNHPEACAKLDVEKLAGVTRPGIELLHSLIETVQAEPNITTAGLLERWRNDDEGRHLGKLAAVEIPEEEEFDPVIELEACLEHLALAGRRERVDFLIEKQKLKSLTDEERSELRQLH